jgi:hypothetical protein
MKERLLEDPEPDNQTYIEVYGMARTDSEVSIPYCGKIYVSL